MLCILICVASQQTGRAVHGQGRGPDAGHGALPLQGRPGGGGHAVQGYALDLRQGPSHCAVFKVGGREMTALLLQQEVNDINRRGSIPLWELPSAYTIFYFLTQG